MALKHTLVAALLGLMLTAPLTAEPVAGNGTRNPQQVRHELAVVSGQLGARTRVLSRDNAEVKAIHARIKQLHEEQKKLESEMVTLMQSADQEYKQLREKQGSLRNELASLKQPDPQDD